MADRPLHKATHQEMRELAADLVAIEQRLHRVGLHTTARATNRAVQFIGYEFAGDFVAITKLREEARTTPGARNAE